MTAYVCQCFLEDSENFSGIPGTDIDIPVTDIQIAFYVIFRAELLELPFNCSQNTKIVQYCWSQP